MFLDFVMRIMVAGLIGLLIGAVTKSEPGARLFGIVAMGAALLTLVSTEFFKMLSMPWIADPARLSAQVVSALGFIGSGMIWLGEDRQVQGVSAASALWLTALLGLVVGTGFRNVTVGAIVFIVAIVLLNRFVQLEPILSAMGKMGLIRPQSDADRLKQPERK